MEGWVANLLIAFISAVFAAGGAYMAVRTELRYMRRDIDRNAVDIEKLRDEKNADVKLLHERISRRPVKDS